MEVIVHRRCLELFFLVTLLAFLPSCGEKCDPPPCETATFSSRLLSGSVTLAFGDGTEQTFRVGESCNNEFTWRFLRDEILRDDQPNASPVRVLECASEANRVAITLNGVGDPRLFAEGKRTATGQQAGLRVEVAWAGARETCAFVMTEGTVTFDVTEHAGTTAPYPKLVSSGYVRRYDVHAELGGALARCVSVSIVADFAVEQAESDIMVHPPTQCRGCI